MERRVFEKAQFTAFLQVIKWTLFQVQIIHPNKFVSFGVCLPACLCEYLILFLEPCDISPLLV